MTPEDFIAEVSPAARASMQTSKIPASFTVAEAADESGWGTHAPGMNLFGVKADASWHGPVMIRRTREYVKGVPTIIEARFRAYSDWLGSIEDHAQFLLTNPRYRPAFAYSCGINFAQAIAAAGYATDPQYAQKIISIIKTHSLSALDIA